MLMTELRARYSLTQEQTAKKLGVSTTTYCAWENNFGMVRLSMAKKIADLFQVKIDDIFLPNDLKNNQVKEEESC